MNLHGERVLLRAVESGDNDMLLTMLNDPEIEYMLGGWSFPASGEGQRQWFARVQNPADPGCLRCVIENEAQKAIGMVMLNPIDYKNGNAQIHIKLCGEYGKGYGSEAVSTLVAYAFDELRLHCVYAHINDYNTASQRMFENCGFVREGTLRARVYKRGAYHDELVYSVIGGTP